MSVTRNIKLKFVLNKNSEEARMLLETHKIMNEAVAYYENILLLFRGEDYYTMDEQGNLLHVTADEVKKGLKDMLAKNAVKYSSFERAAEILREIYDYLCNTENEAKIGSQEWRATLFSEESKAGLKYVECALEVIPDWVEKMQKDINGWKQEADLWYEENQDLIKKMCSGSGRNNKLKNAIKNDQEWYKPFVDSQKSFIKKKQEFGNLKIKVMNENLTYIARPFFKSMGKIPVNWETLAFVLAVQHLKSWNTWGKKAKAKYEELKNKLENMLADIRTNYSEQYQTIVNYQVLKQKENKGFETEAEFLVNSRQARGLELIVQKWEKVKNNYKSRKIVLNELQKTVPEKIGDVNFMDWLAKEENEDLWRNLPALRQIIRYNSMLLKFNKMKNYAIYTKPEAIEHPRWVEYESKGGTNLRNYELKKIKDGICTEFPVLDLSQGGFVEKKVCFKLAPSDQFKNVAIEGKNITFESGNERYDAALGGAKILFNRESFENSKRNDLMPKSNKSRLHRGVPKAAWLSLTVKISTDEENERKNNRPAKLFFQKSLLNEKSTEGLKEGIRIIAVDLGLRNFACCSIFEVVKEKPEGGLYCEIIGKDKTLYGVHDRSFRLLLPGEDVPDSVKRKRREAFEELQDIRRKIAKIKGIWRMYDVNDREKRLEQLDIVKELVKGVADSEVEELYRNLESNPEKWNNGVISVFKTYEKYVGEEISQWRRRTKSKKKRDYFYGKSAEAIEYLERVRRTLLSWETHARSSGQINRQDKNRRGTVAKRLLAHIKNLKEDRIKTGTDLIIQAARGYAYNAKRKEWEKVCKECNVIVFEDLSRYSFRTDRPRKENSQLMKWSHRKIAGTAKQKGMAGQQGTAEQQAAQYGIAVYDGVGAGFSSRFDAMTGCPGERCAFLSEEHFENGVIKQHIASKILGVPGNAREAELKPGLLVPYEGGELFATLRRDAGSGRKLHVTHADINAAQNLAKRYLSKYIEPQRLVAYRKEEAGRDLWIPELGERMKSVMTVKYGTSKVAFVKTGNGYELKEENIGVQKALVEDADNYEEKEMGKGKEAFFRDCSGIIFPMDRWYPSKEFWGKVGQIMLSEMLRQEVQK